MDTTDETANFPGSEQLFPVKKHKKHKKYKHEDKLYGSERSGIKLILKVGSSSTPEHSDSCHSNNYSNLQEESMHSSSGHKKSKKKKKKKEKDRDRHEKKKKHHHKEKKKRSHDESSQDCASIVDESSLIEAPAPKEEPEEKPDPNFNSDSQSSREPRTCVQLQRKKLEKTPLQKMLLELQRQLEKKDPQKFFAWPVTDQIAPGYSQTILHPMDFSTILQKIDDNAYKSFDSFSSDVQLMCRNAMVYNHPETIYYKAAKKLLQYSLKLLNPDKLRPMYEDFLASCQQKDQNGSVIETGDVEIKMEVDSCDTTLTDASNKRKSSALTELTNFKYDSESEEMSPEQILEQARSAAKASADKLSLKRIKTNMGFLRQQMDGSTSLAVIIPTDGVTPDRPREKAVSLGQLIGKLNHGSGQLQGFKEDRRNIAKSVKPLNYGAFGSYAPSFDSTFANISKEESHLLYETYGDENATSYAESVLNFARDCDYTLAMVDNLLDLLTGGEHRKSKSVIDEQRKFREEEERVKELMDPKAQNGAAPPAKPNVVVRTDFPSKQDIDQLKSLAELGIDTSFLTAFEEKIESACVQDKLDQTTALLEKLQQVQNDRLSAPPPPHLSQILPPSDNELNLAEKITESLTELSKQVPPSAIVSLPGLRKAMGVVPENTNKLLVNGPSVDLDEESNSTDGPCVNVSQLDLESELREFLESDTALTSFPLHDDKTIEEMLSES